MCTYNKSCDHKRFKSHSQLSHGDQDPTGSCHRHPWSPSMDDKYELAARNTRLISSSKVDHDRHIDGGTLRSHDTRIDRKLLAILRTTGHIKPTDRHHRRMVKRYTTNDTPCYVRVQHVSSRMRVIHCVSSLTLYIPQYVRILYYGAFG